MKAATYLLPAAKLTVNSPELHSNIKIILILDLILGLNSLK